MGNKMKSEFSGYILLLYAIISYHSVVALDLPVLDLSLPLSELVIPFKNALKSYGFFYVKNHGIDIDLMDDTFNQSKAFFAESMDYKTEYEYFNNRGFIEFNNKTGQFGSEKSQRNIPDQKEGFVLMWPDYDINKPFYGKNRWPQLQNQPLYEFEHIMMRYKQEMNDINMKLIQLFALSLGLSDDYFLNANNMLFTADQLLELVLWHYMPIISDPINGLYATGEHSDWNMLSILAIDRSQGLQVQIDNEWYDVEYKANMLIINSGNMAKVMTNGYYQSSYHRVILKEDKDRYSMVYFISPNYEYILNCVGPKCSKKDIESSEYQQDMMLNAGQFLSKMFHQHTYGYDLKQEL